MTNPRQIAANRANARSSTGPRTEQGKARSSRSALRYGLSIPVLSDPVLARKVEDLALKIVGETSNPALLELARAIAEAQVDLERVRTTRHLIIARIPGEPDHDGPTSLIKPFPSMRRETQSSITWQYRQKDIVKYALKKIEDTTRTDPAQRFLTALSDRRFTLESLERYERRALSRRKFAIRAFDEAWAEAGQSKGSADSAGIPGAPRTIAPQAYDESVQRGRNEEVE
jgi:hypothetical protein